MAITHQFHYPHAFILESGEVLPEFQLAYTTLGELNEDASNVVWICHALTGSADPTEWWPGIVGKGKVIDPVHYFIVSANVLGGCYGSTGPFSLKPNTQTPYFHSFPQLSQRDVVNAFDLLRDHLGLKMIHTLIGGSLGGQQALEWSIQRPSVFKNLIAIATNAKHSPWGIAFNETQRMAIEQDITWQLSTPRAGMQGLQTARAMAMLSYRTYDIYEQKQEDADSEKTDFYRASSYQQYQGIKLSKRFNAYTYYVLTKMMDSHQVGRRRSSTINALQQIQARTLIVGVDTDILFPLQEQEFLSRHIPNAQLEVIHSDYGHDGFLTEDEQLSAMIQKFCNEPFLKETIDKLNRLSKKL